MEKRLLRVSRELSECVVSRNEGLGFITTSILNRVKHGK
jgi:hypothetical protein